VSHTPTAVPVDDLERAEVAFADGTSGRLYYHPSMDQPVPSVTTVEDLRVDPDKEDALDGWRTAYDGTDKWSCPHWADQLAYKAARGTLGHYAILDQLDTVARSEEEDDAEYKLKHWAEERPTVANRGGTYDNHDIPEEMLAPQGDPSHYEGEPAWDHCLRDIDWAIGEFGDVAEDYGITESSTIATEKYVLDEEIGYSGQFDLLYEAPDGAVVLGDLKLSSGIRIGYKLQLAAYANALDRHVDRLQVIRLHPDSQEVEVEGSRDWERSVTGLCHEFLGLTDRCHAEKIRPLDQQTLFGPFEDDA